MELNRDPQRLRVSVHGQRLSADVKFYFLDHRENYVALTSENCKSLEPASLLSHTDDGYHFSAAGHALATRAILGTFSEGNG